MVACERREPVEIARPDTGHGHLDGLAARVAEFAKQAPHGSCRELVAMRVREHRPAARGAQYGNDLREFRPGCRRVPGSAARQPSLEGVADAPRMAGLDERTGEMLPGRHRVVGEHRSRERSSRQPRLAFQAFAHFGDARPAPLADPGEQGAEIGVVFIEAETDEMQRLPVPAAGNLDAGDVAQAARRAGRARGGTAFERVVIGEREQRYPARRAQLYERFGLEHAVGMTAVQVQVGDGRCAHHRYDSPMTLSPAQAPDWDSIDTVLLDLDGTLLDLAFDNYIWLARVAEIYAENHGLSLAETHAELAPRFRRVQGTLEWYSIDYWTAQLGIDIARVHHEESHRVAWLPGARGFLERTRERGKRLVLMTNSHPAILAIKQERTGVLRYLDAAYTSHGFGAPKEDQRFWLAAREVEPFDPQRTMFVDDSRAVLHAAIEAGVRWVYGVKRPDTSREPHDHEEFAAIDGVADLG